MRIRFPVNILFIILLTLPGLAWSQAKYTVSGNIIDSDNGEDLIGARVAVLSVKQGVVSNSYGFYSLTLEQGEYDLEFSSIGYESKTIHVVLNENRLLNVSLKEESIQLAEVVISAEKRNANVTRSEMSVEKLSSKDIKLVPALMGEVDVIKAIQLLPGVQAVAEGSSSFSVRGGGRDQNLILLDEAIVYSASHLMGFFSVFNNDVVKDVKLYKGDFPANYGGRLASLVDIRIKDGNNRRFSGTGGIGTISSRLTLEGPIGTEKLTFLVSGRRTYADIFLPLATDESARDSKLYFYDMNAKVSYKMNDNNRFFLAGYFGRDVMSMAELMDMNFGNRTLTLRWNHIFSPKLFSNFSLIYSYYDYMLGSNISDFISEKWKSHLQDLGLKMDFSYQPNPANNIKFGYNLIHHTSSPIKGGGYDESIFVTFTPPDRYALDHALYVSNETTLFEKLTLKYGLRWSVFQNMGNGSYDYMLENYQVSDSVKHKKGEIFHTQSRLEPRLGANYVFDEKNSVKASYSYTTQYLQSASNSAAGSPLEVWVQASQNVKPQVSSLFSVGYFRNFSDNMFESSVEIYYKDMKNIVDFKDRADLITSSNIEEELRFGVGYAYGIEFTLRKNAGNLTGWVSYAYARSFRKVDEVNDGEWYKSNYDRPNNVSIVLNYNLSAKWNFSTSWVFATGMPATFPTDRYEADGLYVPVYSKRNEYRYPDYHRLDLSATLKLSKPQNRFQHELNFSLYNAYGRKNPWMISFQKEENTHRAFAEMVYLFSFVPSITWNFTF